MSDTELTRFGQFEKRDKQLKIYCTVKERKAWRKALGKNLSKQCREWLNEAYLKGKRFPIPKAGPKHKSIGRLVIRCTASELWLWRMIMDEHRTNSYLHTVIRDMLNTRSGSIPTKIG